MSWASYSVIFMFGLVGVFRLGQAKICFKFVVMEVVVY